MVTENRVSDLVDPLENFSGPSLFSRTFDGLPPDASNPHGFNRQLQALHDHLKSKALRSPDKLREQAKKILDGNSKSLNSKIMGDQASLDKSEALPAMPEVNPRERRPALNRKRARFSLKPNSSQPAVIEPTLDVKKFKNPEEFFMAYERHENAKREIQKQMGGVLSDSKQQNSSLIERPRRPGMQGLNKRRSIKYKHLYLLEDSETVTNVSSSQERNDSSILSPIYQSSQQETEHDFTSQETELAGSISKEDDKVDEILEQLLSYCEDLEGDGALSLLQQHLQIKPVELEKLQLPDFQEIPKIDLKSSRSGKLPRRSLVLSDIDNILKGSSKTPNKQRLVPQSPISIVASPTPPKNPFAAMSLLNKRILHSSLSNDPFSAHDIDQPVKNYSRVESINKEFDLDDEGKQSKETVVEKDDSIEVVKTNTSKQDGFLDVGSSASHIPVGDNTINCNMDDRVMNDEIDLDDEGNQSEETPVEKEDNVGVFKTNTSKQDEFLDVGSNASHIPVDDNTIDSNMDCAVMIDEACEHVANGDDQTNRTNVEDEVEGTLQETQIPTESGLETVDLAVDNSNNKKSSLEKQGTASIQDQARDGNSGIGDNASEQHTEMEGEHSKIPSDKKRKAKMHSRKAPKRIREISGRKSLGGAGTKWESGVRRSTRIRCRPLEYWKGERLLYGRVHKSLPTVIGLKSASPGKANALTVKSYVSDEHWELVELAGFH